MRPRQYPDFFPCGHMRVAYNMVTQGIRYGKEYYRCRQCANQRGRERRRKKREVKPKINRKKRLFPCGHPRREPNILWYKQSKKKGRPNRFTKKGSCCKICSYAKRNAYYRLHKQEIDARNKKRQPEHIIGSITVGRCYESDRQCGDCGYMLRYTNNRKCVVCIRVKASAKYAQRLALAKMQHTRDSDIHRGGKSELTNTTDLRQDASP